MTKLKPNYPGQQKLVKHRKKNCECSFCYRELARLPPLETNEEHVAAFQFEEREIKRAKKKAKKEVKHGKQATIKMFFSKG
jgi:hypothetical protein